MLAVILEILSVLGIILLILLSVLIAVLLLIFFFPVSYEIAGRKNTGGIAVRVCMSWLFGLLRAGYVYPEPGRLVVKLLFLTLFDSGAEEPGRLPEKQKKQKKQKKKKNAMALKEPDEETDYKEADDEGAGSGNTGRQEEKPDLENADPAGTDTGYGTKGENRNYEGTDQPGEHKAEKLSVRERLLAKFAKIKYTIRKIYDKIKNVLENLSENISFYRELLEEEASRELFRHGCFRLGKLWKNVKPRKIKADILFGAASPDVTGYVYGVYGMISPGLGKHICVTPDFNRAVLEGRAEISGNITVFTILWNGMCFAFDKRLRFLIRKVKEHGLQTAEQIKKNNNTPNNDPKNNYAQGTT